MYSNGKAESTQDSLFSFRTKSPLEKQQKKKDIEETKSTAASFRTHDLQTVSRRPNDLTMQDNRRPAAYVEHSSYSWARCV